MQYVMAYWIVIGVVSSNPGPATDFHVGYCLSTACLDEMYNSMAQCYVISSGSTMF